MAEIISFNRGKPRPSTALDAGSPALERAYRETPRQAAGRRRNPLRQHAERISLAVKVAGKLANGDADQMREFGDDYVVGLLRRAADAARFLADEFDRALDTLLVEKIDTALAERAEWDEPEPA